jgi:hypothetical protein
MKTLSNLTDDRIGKNGNNDKAGKPRLKLLGRELQLVQIDAKARRQAAAVLEVLAGLWTPQQAAEVLEVSLPTYFHLEIKALRGLLWACAPTPPGRQHTLSKRLREAEQHGAELERQVNRYQALLRTAQRDLGISASAVSAASAKAGTPGKGKRPKRAAVRALRAIKLLTQVQERPPVTLPAPLASALPAPDLVAGPVAGVVVGGG